MKVQLTLGLAFGFGIGALHVLQAQTKPSVYYIAEVDVTDLDGYVKEFVPKAATTRRLMAVIPSPLGKKSP